MWTWTPSGGSCAGRKIMRETYLYPYSAEEACRRGEQSLWRARYLGKNYCKEAIQKTVRQHYEGAHPDKESLKGGP